MDALKLTTDMESSSTLMALGDETLAWVPAHDAALELRAHVDENTRRLDRVTELRKLARAILDSQT